MAQWTEKRIMEEAKGLWTPDENIFTAIKGDLMFRYIPEGPSRGNLSLPAFAVRKLDPETGRWILQAEVKTEKPLEWNPLNN